MDRRVLLLFSMIVALEIPITKPRIYAQAENPHPIIIYVTNAEQSTPDETNNLKVHMMKKHFNDLSHDEFQSTTNLKTLIISDQTISESWLHEKDYLFASPTVKEFYLTDNNLLWLPTNAFARMPNLTFLSLANNHLRDVNLTSMKQLEGLDLSRNFITRFSHVFLDRLGALTHLRTLNLADNSMSNVYDIKSRSLLKLDLSGNNIYTLEKNELVNLPFLDTLIIARNKIKKIDPLAFANSNRLTVLDLSDNEKLGRLPIFKMSPSRQKAYGLFSFDCANCGIKEIAPGTFNAMANLVKLNLARNNLKILPGRFFENLPSLQSLDLTNNSISWIPNGMFVGARSLNFLSLEGNPLKKLSFVPFLKTPRLSILNVARCGLSHLWDPTNGVLNSLKTVSFAKNFIWKITDQELAVTPNLQHMDISGNPLQYREGQWGVMNIEKGPRELQNSAESSYSMVVTKQVLKITIESPRNQTALDELANAEFIYQLEWLGCVIGALSFTAAIIFGLFYWCCREESPNKKPVKSLPEWRNFLKFEKSTDIKYEPLEEDVVKTISKLEIKLTE